MAFGYGLRSIGGNRPGTAGNANRLDYTAGIKPDRVRLLEPDLSSQEEASPLTRDEGRLIRPRLVYDDRRGRVGLVK